MSTPKSENDSTMAPRTVPIPKSENDTREFRGLILPNGLKVLLVRDHETKKPAAALAVGVGAGRDPPCLPGLAHFTEHMSMQGSALYPGDNAYKKYLNDHGGSSNATTSMEHTWYRFSVVEKADDGDCGSSESSESSAERESCLEAGKAGSVLEGALDRFASFFAAPAFDPSCLAREIHAIDAEDAKNRTSDDRRLLQVLKAVVNPACSYAKFSTGNKRTLQDTPAALDPPP